MPTLAPPIELILTVDPKKRGLHQNTCVRRLDNKNRWSIRLDKRADIWPYLYLTTRGAWTNPHGSSDLKKVRM